MNRRTLAWLALNHIPGAGAVTVLRLVARLGSPQAALEAPAAALVANGGLSPAQAQALQSMARDPSPLERLAQRMALAGVQLMTFEDEAYPRNLRMLRDAPPLLYLRGSLRAHDQKAVAIIGTRTPSEAGARAAEETAQELASRGVTIVSGLALGIDAAAHRGALAAGQELRSAGDSADVNCGRTIAVLGSGIDRATPRQHRSLAEEVAHSGALMSEAPPGTPACRETLLARNRIQAGLSKPVIVAQCRTRGGSFTTARRALAAGRQVFAVAWDQPEFRAGVRRLETMGARVVSLGEAIGLATEAACAPLPQAQQPDLALDDTAYGRGE